MGCRESEMEQEELHCLALSLTLPGIATVHNTEGLL